MAAGKQHESEDHRDDLVEVVRLGPVESALVAAKLREAGLEVAVFEADNGLYPGLAFAEGSRVMVRRRDLAAAEAIVRESSPG